MSESMLQLLGTLGVAIIGLLGVLISRDRSSRAIRNMKSTLQLIKDTPPESAALAQLNELYLEQVRFFVAPEKAKAARKLNVTNVVLSSITSAAMLWGVWGCLSLVFSSGGNGWAIALTVLVSLATVIIAAGAFGTIYNPPAEKKVPETGVSD